MNKTTQDGSKEFTSVKIPPRCREVVERNRELLPDPPDGSVLSNRAVVEEALLMQSAVLNGKKELVDADTFGQACREADMGKAILEYLKTIGIRFKILDDGASFDPVIDRNKLSESLGLYPGWPIRRKTADELLKNHRMGSVPA